MKNQFFIIMNFIFFILFLQQLLAKKPDFQIQGIEEVFPGIYQKLKNENRILDFNLSQLTPKRDKAAILYQDKIEIVNSNGGILVTYKLVDYGLSRPSGHNAWNKEGTKFICSIRSGNGRISLYLLDVKGNLKEIVTAPESRGQVLQPEWSYDGKFISYVKSSLGSESKSSVFFMNINTGEEKQIGSNLSGKAKWMNHSNRLFYENAIPPFNTPKRPKRELYCFDVRDNSNFKFYHEPFARISITFPIDDTFIVVNSDSRLLTLDLLGRQVKKFEINSTNPQVSPDNKYVAFIYFEEDGERILNQFIKILDLEDGAIYSILIDKEKSLHSIIWLENSMILFN